MGSKGGGGGGDNRPFPRNVGEAGQLLGMQEDFFNRALQRQAELNFFDVVTPFGTRTFAGTPGQEGFQQTITLNPFQQGLMDFGQQQLGGLGQTFGGIPGGDLMQGAADVERATFERGMNLLEPQFERQQERLENQLIQRGIPRSSEAFQEEFRTRIDDPRNRALENLALSSVGAGRAEQSRLLQADLARRGQRLGELGFFGSGGVTQPSFQPTPAFGAQAPDALGAFGLLNQNIANQNAAAADKKGQTAGAAGGLGSAAILAGMFCSHKFKHENEPCEEVLDKVCDLTVERWKYKGDNTPHLGPYAEEFKKLFGVGTDHIISTVDAVGVCLKAIQELRAEVRALKGTTP